MTAVRNFVRSNVRNPNAIAYFLMAVGALFFPAVVQFATGGSGDYLVGLAADGGLYMLMAIGLNVVLGFAGLLALGYAAFFAIGSYTYALVASNHLGVTPIGHSLHVPLWIPLFIGMFFAAGAGALLGAPTLRLRGDYLAIVTLGFGEIVPRVFRNASIFTGGVNGIVGLDQPKVPPVFGWSGNFGFNPIPWYYLILMVIIVSLFFINNLSNSRLGRAWRAIREAEVAGGRTAINR